MVEIRYALIPYLYSEFVKCALNDESYFRPIAFDYEDDKQARLIEDQLMVGESIMIAPMYEQASRGRFVYLPEDMKMIKMRSLDDYEETQLTKGNHFIHVNLNELIFFIKPNHIVPLAKPALTTKDMNFDDLYIMENVNKPIEYDDDGYTRNMDIKEHYHTINVSKDNCSCKTKNVKFFK